MEISENGPRPAHTSPLEENQCTLCSAAEHVVCRSLPPATRHTATLTKVDFSALPLELRMEVVRGTVEHRWVSILEHDLQISYYQTCTTRQLLQTNHKTMTLTEDVLASVYKHSVLRVDVVFSRWRGGRLGEANAEECNAPERCLTWKDMATWCGTALMMALQGPWYAERSDLDGKIGLRFDEKVLGTLVENAVRHLRGIGLARKHETNNTPTCVTDYQLRVFLADAIPQLLINRALEVTVVLAGFEETSGNLLEGTVQDLRYLADRLAVSVRLCVRCRDAHRPGWEAWFRKAKGVLDIEYGTLDEWWAARPLSGPMNLWPWKVESVTGVRMYGSVPDLMH